MDNVVQLPPRIEFRRCPGCGRLEDQQVIEMIHFDQLCLGCREYRLSDYVPDTFRLSQDTSRGALERDNGKEEQEQPYG